MKLKIMIIACALMQVSANARLNGFDNATSFEKSAQGFEVTNLKLEKKNTKAIDLTTTFGRDGKAFKLLVNGVVLLPKKGETPRIKLGAFGIELNPDLSLDIYNELAVDYTPKKIKEGIASGDSVFKCQSLRSVN